jgi:hypothetical protein
MKKKRSIFIGLVLLAVGLALWSTNMQRNPTPEKQQKGTAPTEPVSEQPPASEPIKKIADSKDLQEKSDSEAEVDPEFAEIEAPERGLAELAAISEETLVGTEWGNNGFTFEFGPKGKLLIGGSVRANWRIEGDRVKLYSHDEGEVHWLDITGNRLSWNGEPIGRFK